MNAGAAPWGGARRRTFSNSFALATPCLLGHVPIDLRHGGFVGAAQEELLLKAVER